MTTTAGDRATGTTRTRRWYPPEVRAEAVVRVQAAIEEAGGSRYGVFTRVAREMDIGPSTLRSWFRRAESELVIDLRDGAPPVRLQAVRRAGAGIDLRDDAPLARPRRLPGAPTAVLAPAGERAPTPASGDGGPEPVGALRRRAVPVVMALRRPLAFYLGSRVVVLLAVVAGALSRGGLVDRRGFVLWPVAPRSGTVLDGFSVWDAAWYLHIAAHGYAPPPLPTSPLGGDMAFFPLFPVLVRGLSVVTGLSPLAAGWVLALLTGGAAVAGVWYATRAVAGAAVADRAAAVWALFPGAFVLSLVYAEGLTIACAALCLLALHRRRWVVAGLAAAAGTAVQPSALVLIVCCAWAAGVALWNRRDWRSVAAPVLAPLGAVAYFAYLWARTGDPKAWFDGERLFWSRGHFGPYWTVVRPVDHFLHDPSAVLHNPGMWDNGIRVAGLLMAAGALWLVWRWRPPATWSIWSVGVVALALWSAPVGTRPRFLLVAFPLVVAVARRLPRGAFYLLVPVEAFLLGALTFVTVTTLNVVP